MKEELDIKTRERRIKTLCAKLLRINIKRQETLAALSKLGRCSTCGGPTRSGYCSESPLCDADVR